MAKCKCGFKNDDSAIFCSKCGEKLGKTCPICNAFCSFDSRFCNSCGHKFSNEKEGKVSDGADMSGNVIAGDVSGSYNTTYSTSVINNYYDQPENDTWCAVCNRLIPAESKSVFQCKTCGKHYCAHHMDTVTKVCMQCSMEHKESALDRAKQKIKLCMYDEAMRDLTDAMLNGADDPDAYYYAAIASLNGKKAFVQPKEVIDRAINYINTAIRIRPKGKYYYLLAYIKYDYHERKFLNTTPNYKMALLMARDNGISEAEIKEMYVFMNITRPSVL